MTPQPIDNYRLTSLEEPTDEMLAQLMHEAAEEAKQKEEEATARFFRQLKRDAENMNAGELKEPRLTLFKELLELSEKYKRKNQYG